MWEKSKDIDSESIFHELIGKFDYADMGQFILSHIDNIKIQEVSKRMFLYVMF